VTSEPSTSCPLCNGSGWIRLGSGDLYSPCPEYMEAEVERRLKQAPRPIADALRGKKLMPGYRYSLPNIDANLTAGRRVAIEPSEYAMAHGFPLAAQKAVIEKLGGSPLLGYIFFGPTGTGKTFLLWALMQEAVYANRRAVYYTAGSLARLISSQRDDDAAELEIIRAPERWMGSPLHLYIDELDSIPSRDVVLRALFEIFSAAYDTGAVVLSVASNAGLKALENHIGSASMRRLLDLATPVKTSK
jgi:hypothetical protein